MTARIGLHMAAPDVAAEEREERTEWVNMLVVSPKLLSGLKTTTRAASSPSSEASTKIRPTRTGSPGLGQD